jgi:hypothetical protein
LFLFFVVFERTHTFTWLTPCDTHFSSIVHKQAPWPTHTLHTHTLSFILCALLPPCSGCDS